MSKRHIIMAGLLLALAAAPARAQGAPGTKFRDCRDCPEMVLIPAGSFTMGSPKAEAGRFDNEGPEHQVTIPRAFAMSLYNVTVAEYRRFVRATGYATTNVCRIHNGKELAYTVGKSWEDPNFVQTERDPVVCVTWEDALAYIDWLNSQIKTGSAPTQASGYRLPSEAEWEYAARAGTKTAFYWGDKLDRSKGNYGPDELRFAAVAKDGDRWKYTSPSGSFPANRFGLYDMAGNVWQITRDCWHDNYIFAPSDGSAWIEGKCDGRVVRGGSWLKPPAGERSAKRGDAKIEDLSNHEIGFRIVRDLAAR